MRSALLASVRRVELDRLRGLAVLLMVGDHLAIALDLSLYRVTFGRLAMPLFFVLAGHLAGRVGRRHLWAVALGVGLPLVVPFVDSPNVLVWWAAGCVLLRVFARFGWPVWALILLALALMANGWGLHLGATSYDPFALWALMGVGALLPASAFRSGVRLPSWVGVLGRYPLSWYVGHAVALQLVLVAVGRG